MWQNDLHQVQSTRGSDDDVCASEIIPRIVDWYTQLAPYTICMQLIKIQYMSDDVEDTNYMMQHREFLCIAT